ncbi:HAD family hydrolase [Sphingobacterium multivorum]|uniref:HAD family hydrolase n=1 Tax=Sphingobacterium multivorum TaxID=28454 RepID=UPI00368D239E
MKFILKEKEAATFDMDGVLVNTEKFWRQAEYEVFSELGVVVTDELSLLTQSMSTKEVTEFWFQMYPWNDKLLKDVELSVVYRVMELIRNSDCCIPGVQTFIETLKSQDIKIGLATNSPEIIIPVVLEKTKTLTLFDAISSADAEVKGKPHPSIYLNTARKLNVSPEKCFVIEDSIWGIEAGIRAGMTVIQFSNDCNNYFNSMADFVIHDFRDALTNLR